MPTKPNRVTCEHCYNTVDAIVNLKGFCYSHLVEYAKDLASTIEDQKAEIDRLQAVNLAAESLLETLEDPLTKTLPWILDREVEALGSTVDAVRAADYA